MYRAAGIRPEPRLKRPVLSDVAVLSTLLTWAPCDGCRQRRARGPADWRSKRQPLAAAKRRALKIARYRGRRRWHAGCDAPGSEAEKMREKQWLLMAMMALAGCSAAEGDPELGRVATEQEPIVGGKAD